MSESEISEYLRFLGKIVNAFFSQAVCLQDNSRQSSSNRKDFQIEYDHEQTDIIAGSFRFSLSAFAGMSNSIEYTRVNIVYPAVKGDGITTPLR